MPAAPGRPISTSTSRARDEFPRGGHEMAVAAKLKGEDRKSVAIIGDGAMSAGMAFEALNNGGVSHADMLVVLNDNDMSISPPVGALNRHLARLMSGRFYATARDTAKSVLKNAPPLFELVKRFEEHAKGMVVLRRVVERIKGVRS